MPTPLLSETTSFITFYSFKGGVGRTMSLLNVAAILARQGNKVLMVDFDLEAPGLTVLRSIDEKKRTEGLVELLTEAIQTPEASPLFAAKPDALLKRFTFKLDLPKNPPVTKGGGLWLLPSGRPDETYSTRLHDLDFGSLYAAGVGKPLFSRFKEVLRDSQQFDYVLIDSRTGHSDEAGICSRELADHIFVVMGLNWQNVQGTTQYLQRLKAREWKGEVEFVFSPIPTGYEELFQSRLNDTKKQFTDLGFPVQDPLFVPYHPRLALDEDPFLYDWTTTDIYSAWTRIQERVTLLSGASPEDLVRRVAVALNQRNLSAALRPLRVLAERHPLHANTSVLRALTLFPKEDQLYPFAAKALSLDDITDTVYDPLLNQCEYDLLLKLTKAFESEAKRTNDDYKRADSLIRQSRIAYFQDNYDHALSLSNEALTLYQSLNDPHGEANCLWSLGDIARRQGEYEKATPLLEQSLAIAKQIGYRGREADCLLSLGNIARMQGQYKLAKNLLDEACALYQYINSKVDIGWARYSLWLLSKAQNQTSSFDFEAAKEAWQSIGREDLIEQMLTE